MVEFQHISTCQYPLALDCSSVSISKYICVEHHASEIQYCDIELRLKRIRHPRNQKLNSSFYPDTNVRLNLVGHKASGRARVGW